uniref:Outer membrane protein beta-barrel domain-containing protein n=1 Tax=Prevotella sp. Sc00033 TaxID=1231729 RepID=W5QSX3_9BACT|nr:hypothetical protein [Prevotella sp. Sc00033]
MKEDWTKQMKQKLEGHQMTPPAGLWEGISSEMHFEPDSTPKSTPKSVVMRRWYWAAAAVILAITGFFAFYHFDDSEPQMMANNEKTIATEATEKPLAPAEKPELLALTPIKKETVTKKVKQIETIVETNQQPAEDIYQQETTETKQESPEPQQEEPTETKILASSEKKQTYLPDITEPDVTSIKSDDIERWTLGLNGSSGLLMASNNYVNSMNSQSSYNNGHLALDENPNLSNYYNSALAFTTAQMIALPDVISKHHIPVRFGLSLQYQLNNQIALHSGISYTYLESEFIVPLYNNKSYTQKLKYLGIPLGASWKLWSSSGFNLYIAGSALVEKCISAEVSDDDINQRPWQFSLNVSAGAEYHVTRQFGLYLEPSLGYYFDDGTSVEHYYKEHPLAPSIQFGLRLHLK